MSYYQSTLKTKQDAVDTLTKDTDSLQSTKKKVINQKTL